MKINTMKTNHIENPMGYMMEKPVFSHKVSDVRGKKQKAGRILVSKNLAMTDIVYDRANNRVVT